MSAENKSSLLKRLIEKIISTIIFYALFILAIASIISKKFPPDLNKVKTMVSQSIELLQKSQDLIAKIDLKQIESLKNSLDPNLLKQQAEAQAQFIKEFSDMKMEVSQLKAELNALKVGLQQSKPSPVQSTSSQKASHKYDY